MGLVRKERAFSRRFESQDFAGESEAALFPMLAEMKGLRKSKYGRLPDARSTEAMRGVLFTQSRVPIIFRTVPQSRTSLFFCISI